MQFATLSNYTCKYCNFQVQKLSDQYYTCNCVNVGHIFHNNFFQYMYCQIDLNESSKATIYVTDKSKITYYRKQDNGIYSIYKIEIDELLDLKSENLKTRLLTYLLLS